MFPKTLLQKAKSLLDDMRRAGLKIAVAESCTGGLVTACLTEIAGSSDVVDRGFITYSNEAKRELLGVPEPLLTEYGAVSEPVARAMADGALGNSRADIAVSVTGIAGPDGGAETKPVGLVHFASARRMQDVFHERHFFGDIGRDRIRVKSVEVGLDLLRRRL